MGRPRRHDTDRLLDAAAELARAGPGAVTMAAVARAAGAPSGSVYHRFPGLPALLAALWLRALDRFHDGYLDALRAEPPERAAADAARHVVAWSRGSPDDARVLLYGPSDFGERDWADADRQRLATANERVARALDEVAVRLGVPPDERERVALAAVDVPYALVRRHLRSSGRIPAGAEDLAASAAAAVLRQDA
ncbi:TetR family transcriptional regulator [Actinomadura sp. WMMB 499]|uniref:TetR family transcriptional regulator n=1 Tax=Actinomadura sp. WMMB 499 TaxID=1219491 RepID=UPI0012485765|nr:TetR family transcriptional regulator [Actinomadura sp. WMMB 499]QFG20609.1 TetR family transcriptional regulator [Actinomadura sp. WMMB 499]